MQPTYTIDTLTIKLFGKKQTMFRLFKNGELAQVFDSKEEAEKALPVQA